MEDFDFDLDNLDLPEFPVENFFDEYVAVLQQGQQPQLGASGTSSGATGDSGREGSPVVMPLLYLDQHGSPQAATSESARSSPTLRTAQQLSGYQSVGSGGAPLNPSSQAFQAGAPRSALAEGLRPQQLLDLQVATPQLTYATAQHGGAPMDFSMAPSGDLGSFADVLMAPAMQPPLHLLPEQRGPTAAISTKPTPFGRSLLVDLEADLPMQSTSALACTLPTSGPILDFDGAKQQGGGQSPMKAPQLPQLHGNTSGGPTRAKLASPPLRPAREGSSEADHPMSQDAPSEYSEEKGGQNAGDSKPKGRRRRVQTEYQQMLNKAAQKRYRDRKRQKAQEVENQVKALSTEMQAFDIVKQKNDMLQAQNTRLQELLKAKEAQLAALHGTQADAATPILPGAALQEPGHSRSDSDPGALGGAVFEAENLTRLLHQKIFHLRETMAAAGLTGVDSNQGRPIGADHLAQIDALVEEVSKLSMRALRIEGADVWNMVHGSKPATGCPAGCNCIMCRRQAAWIDIARVLSLDNAQKRKVLYVRKEYLRKLESIQQERQRLNIEAMSSMLPQEAGGSAPEYILSGAAGFASMGFLNRARNSTKHGKVLDALKENLREEQRAASELDYIILRRILSPLQAAWFILEAYPLKANCLAFAHAIFQLPENPIVDAAPEAPAAAALQSDMMHNATPRVQRSSSTDVQFAPTGPSVGEDTARQATASSSALPMPGAPSPPETQSKALGHYAGAFEQPPSAPLLPEQLICLRLHFESLRNAKDFSPVEWQNAASACSGLDQSMLPDSYLDIGRTSLMQQHHGIPPDSATFSMGQPTHVS